ncbi:MAG: hypothetical protein JRF33_21010 [Deltaproteobacteria bacterium]|nr:hypothetical protein [Deltaproteobacteria bacterium]
MHRFPGLISAILGVCLFVCSVNPASAGQVEQDKKQITFINKTMADRQSLIRKQLQAGKLDLAEKNIRGMTKQLAEEARLTKRILAKEPGFSPNPPVDFDASPAMARRAEYTHAKKLAIDAGKQLNKDAQSANAALLKAKSRQLATIAISALKMTIENAPGRQGGKALDLAVEALKKLNGYIMDKTISEPIARISEAKLLKNNFVTIGEAARLLKKLEAAREQVVRFAKEMDTAEKKLDRAAAAEKEWQKYRWLKEAGADSIKVKVLDLTTRELELKLDGQVVKKGAVLEIKNPSMLTARVIGARRKFCVQRREYARTRTKTIILHPGPGGGPEDSLVYSSSRIPAKSSWTIQKESFDWKPSFNSNLEKAPKAMTGTYWKLERDRMRWILQAKPGEQVNVHVKGEIHWLFKRQTRGKRAEKKEKNDGSATLVLKVL